MLYLALAPVVSVNGTLVVSQMCTFTIESTHFIFNKGPIYTHDGASAKFNTNSNETDYGVVLLLMAKILNTDSRNIQNDDL